MKLLFSNKYLISKENLTTLYRENYAVDFLINLKVTDKFNKYAFIIIDNPNQMTLFTSKGYKNKFIIISNTPQLTLDNTYQLPTNYKIADLCAILNAFKESKSDTSLTLGNTTIDFKNLQISSGSDTSPISSQEIALLSILFYAPDEYHASNALFCEVWGYYSDCDISIVYVYFSFLRNKLKTINSNLEIKIKRYLGYCLTIKKDS